MRMKTRMKATMKSNQSLLLRPLPLHLPNSNHRKKVLLKGRQRRLRSLEKARKNNRQPTLLIKYKKVLRQMHKILFLPRAIPSPTPIPPMTPSTTPSPKFSQSSQKTNDPYFNKPPLLLFLIIENPMIPRVQDSTILHVKTQKISIRPLSSHSQTSECRICLSPQQPDNKLISPCGCTGSVKYIHSKCFNRWITKKYEDPLQREEVIGQEGLKCEICQERYMYSFEVISKCSSWEAFKRKVQARKFLFAATILFILVDLILLSIMVNYAVIDKNDPDFDLSQPRFFLVYVALIFALLSFLYGVRELVKNFLMGKAFILVPFNRNEQTRIRVIKGASMESTNMEGAMYDSHMRMENTGHLGQTI